MLTCPKCDEASGYRWEQCGGDCPMPMSPHYNAEHRLAEEAKRRVSATIGAPAQ